MLYIVLQMHHKAKQRLDNIRTVALERSVEKNSFSLSPSVVLNRTIGSIHYNRGVGPPLTVGRSLTENQGNAGSVTFFRWDLVMKKF